MYLIFFLGVALSTTDVDINNKLMDFLENVGELKYTNLFLERGIDCSYRHKGFTIIDVATMHRRIDSLMVLRTYGCDESSFSNYVEYQAMIKDLMFHYNIFNTIQRCDVENLKRLLSYGITPNARHKKGNTLLCTADSSHCREARKILIKHGADKNRGCKLSEL